MLRERTWDPVEKRWSPRQIRLEQRFQWLVYLSARFWAMVERSDEDACWPWQGKMTWNGYGAYTVWQTGGKRAFCTTAHRVAWMLTNGSIPGDLTVDHLCGLRACQNPRHMRLLTLAENVREGHRWQRTKRKS